jgi:hypothetical protein
MARTNRRKKLMQTRLTVSLGPGQRESLADIAARNNATLAFVIRYALASFIRENRDRQLRLRFDDPPQGAEGE